LFPISIARLVEPPLQIARVESQERDAYTVFLFQEDGAQLNRRARLAGALRHAAREPRDFPAVGDYVALEVVEGDSTSVIRAIVARRNLFARRAVGERSALQPIAANLDTLFIVVACNRDFNLRRIERYLSGAESCDISAAIVLTKIDLAADIESYVEAAISVANGRPVVAICALDGTGLDAFDPFRGSDQTLAFVGSSGAGKSTLLNKLLGSEVLEVGAARGDDDRGRHTTTRRQLVLLADGTSIVDTPGMREFGLAAGDEAVAATFDDIAALAAECKFRDCRHESEPGCAVVERLDADRLASWRKLSREALFEASKSDRSIRDAERRRWKALSKSARAFDKRAGK
jgi:ribosome biogenesis GTPase